MNRSIHPVLIDASKRLVQAGWELDTAHLESAILLASVLAVDRTWLVGHDQEQLGWIKHWCFQRLLSRRLKHEPIAYLVGHKEFYGRSFKTDRRALIPRPETELTVERALTHLADTNDSALVVDVGTGSGVIAVTVALEQHDLSIIATDFSTRSLQLAKENAQNHGVDKKIEFLRANLVDATVIQRIQSRKPDRLIVTANLPYLPWNDLPRMQKDVTKYEPHTALFADDEGNALIVRLLEQLVELKASFDIPLVLLAEFDPPQAETLKKHALEQFPQARVLIHQDECGRPRLLEVVT